MSDLALTYRDGLIDLDAEAVTDDSLKTAVIVSLFTDRRAEPDDEIPDGTEDRRGWWGDIYPEHDGDLIGSRLWLLDREKQLPSVLRRAETYAAEALQWLIDDGVAQTVDVSAKNPSDGVLALEIRIQETSGRVTTYTAPVVGTQAGDIITDEGGGLILDESGAPIFD